jgi:hypothetical protein
MNIFLTITAIDHAPVFRAIVQAVIGYSRERDGNFANFLAAPERRAKVLLATWGLSVLLFLLVSVLVLSVAHMVAAEKWGVGITVLLAALWLGGTALMFLPSKAIVTLFGAFLGMSLGEVGSAHGLLSLVSQQITSISKEVGVILATTSNPDPFITGMLWMFVGVFLIMCLPAFFTD